MKKKQLILPLAVLLLTLQVLAVGRWWNGNAPHLSLTELLEPAPKDTAKQKAAIPEVEIDEEEIPDSLLAPPVGMCSAHHPSHSMTCSKELTTCSGPDT